ncbi:MAG: chorismate synthase [Anaerolineales bacterium]|uniref:Chorismate synthase n=1 Tax=Candidatus Desulfolinea nitratireducens TaxID=2841698 RepID=A0A8J6TJV4_9CHLR|nr:chorismate synthase [Candidatus Desulfolinea nitratireducens]MBL6961395.1 chorismate synthase [Anaerolineales bacterium]
MPLRFLTAGESHGPAMLAILEGMPAGLKITPNVIDHELQRRQRGYGAGPRMKLEKDQAIIQSGILEGKTTGAPISLSIINADHEKWKNKDIPPMTAPRPGHADLVGAIKYGYEDLRPSLERASARETSARVAVGAICKHLLEEFGVQIGGYVVSIGKVKADLFDMNLPDRSVRAEESEVRCPNEGAAQEMIAEIESAIKGKNTLGGVIEVVAMGLPPGLGSHVQWDRKLESRLGAAILGIQAIKGVEFGPAFENARLRGTEAQDQIFREGEKLVRKTNRAGGIEGGITNGEPIIIRAAMKPIASTLTPQETVDIFSGEETVTTYERSDFCPVPRAVPIIEAVTAFVLADALLEKLGGDSLAEMLPRFAALKQAKLSDIKLDNQPHKFW